MASAMVEGLLAKGTPASSVSCMSGSGRTASELARKTGITLAASLDDLLSGADALVVAFKPQHLASADPRLASLTSEKLVISVLAGKRLARLSEVFPQARNIVWAMPNTPAQIGAGVTGWCSLHPLSSDDREIVDSLLGSLGWNAEIPETQMDALTAVSGCGPAYVFEFAAALRDAGTAAGLSPEVMLKLASETLLGAARLLVHKGIDPETLRNQVTSPNGVTFAGLKRMEARDFRGLIKDTVLTAKARSEELSKG